MSDMRDLRPKAAVLATLRRTGVPEETVEALDAVLEDPVDLRRDGDLLIRHGVTLGRLTDNMGGSP